MPNKKATQRPSLNNGKRIDTLEEIVQGNGGAGLKGKVIALETWLASIKDDITEIKDNQKWAMRLVAGQFVALIIAIVLYVLNGTG